MIINPQDFITDIPTLNPLSKEYVTYWREQTKRILEGHWIDGYWMPPKLYFYANHGTIKLNKPGSNVKSYGRPFLRDIEWDFFYNWAYARGFSGFEKDELFSCNRKLLEKDLYSKEFLLEKHPSILNDFGEYKDYIPGPEYLRKQHIGNLGAPIYDNNAYNLMMLGARNFGKDIKWDSKLKTEEGEVTIQKIKIGDQIFDSKGNLTRVLHKEKYTDQLQYEIELLDGRIVYAGAGHKWFVREKLSHSYKEHVKTTGEILSNFRTGQRNDYNYWLPITKPINYTSKKLSIDPYFLGLLLGDGSITQKSISLTSNDPEIIDYIKTSDKITKRKNKYAYGIVGGNTRKELQKLNLLGCNSHTKFIPLEYLFGDVKQRLDLLQGLLDTDGYISKSGNIEFVTASKELATGIVILARSLGVYVNEPKNKGKFYRIYMRSAISLFKLKRKVERVKTYKRVDSDYVAIKNITPTKIEESYCISVDNEDKLFLVNDFIPTHNSYMVGIGVILHDFLTDGSFRYEDFKSEAFTTEVMVGAWESKYSNLLLEKTKDSLERLPGETSIGGITYPAPFSRKYKGSWGPGSEVVYTYQKKEGGKWKKKGTKSNIKNRTFADNPYAGIGSRPTVFVVEEVGLCRNTKQIHAAMKDAQRDGYRKFASTMYLGTGGDMDAGALEAQEIFYNPDAFELLPFNDTFENKGKIGYFVPAFLARNEFKDKNGYTRLIEAKDFVMGSRERMKTGSSDALNREIINNPMVPSEMFLTKSSNVFPVAEVRRRLSVVEHEHIYEKLAKKVELYFDPNSEYHGVNYAIDVRNKLTAIDKFPWTADDRDGCVVLYEFPHLIDGKVPEGAYIIGHDPYKDDTNTGESLAAIYVIKTSKHFDTVGHDEIVANFIGRPYMGRDIVNENLLKLSLFYGNAKIYFENAVGNVKDYFEKVKRIDLLARKPHTVFNKKASFETSPIMEYGYPMSNDRIKYEALQYLRAWLLEVRESSDERIIRNIDTIVDKAFLQELLTFSMDANFDRVMAMCGAVIGLNEIGNVNKEQFITGTREVNALTHEFISFIKQNKRLFQNDTFPTTTPNSYGEGQRQFFVG